MYTALIREGYMEVYKFFYKYILPDEESKKINANDVEATFLGRGEIVVLGMPRGNHNCDEMGCSSLTHVIYRKKI